MKQAFVSQEVRRQSSLRAAQTIDPVQVQTTATTIYTAPADSDFWVQHLYAANVSGGASTYSIYFVPSGGTAGATNLVLDAKAIATSTSEVIEIATGHRLPPGASIQAICATNDDVNIGGWGYDITGDA